jgi:hypothetical protein
MPEPRKMPVRVKDIELTGDWAGWSFTGRTNPKMSTLDDLSSGVFRRIASALSEVVLSWNFVDENGTALPNPADIRRKIYTFTNDQKEEEPLTLTGQQVNRETELLDLMKQLPFDLAIAMSKALSDAIIAIDPNS